MQLWFSSLECLGIREGSCVVMADLYTSFAGPLKLSVVAVDGRSRVTKQQKWTFVLSYASVC